MQHHQASVRLLTADLHCVCTQISGGHKYLPPKQDVNAPDLYIPTMAVGTYSLLVCFASAAAAKFKPEVMTSAVRCYGAQGRLAEALVHCKGYGMLHGAPGASRRLST